MAPQEDTTPAVPSVTTYEAKHSAEQEELSCQSSSGSENGDSNGDAQKSMPSRLQRPNLGSRKSSGTMVVSRESKQIELEDESYDENDARTMSPRRNSEEIERMGEDARQALIDQAKALQASLLDICDKVESVRSEHEKLEGGNKFLQSYIGELMQTSKITSTGLGKGKGKGRSSK